MNRPSYYPEKSQLPSALFFRGKQTDKNGRDWRGGCLNFCNVKFIFGLPHRLSFYPVGGGMKFQNQAE